MKRNFLQLKQIRAGARRQAGIWIIVIGLILLAFARFSSVEAVALNLGATLLKFGRGAETFSDFLQEFLTRKAFLVEELETLRSSKLELEARNSTLQAKIGELAKIKNLLNENQNPGSFRQ